VPSRTRKQLLVVELSLVPEHVRVVGRHGEVPLPD